jgi:Tol biopolymer transport system component/predicted Ser/Thr protein kinase
MALAAGTRLGPYEVLGLIGAGGMGEVYRARDSRLERDVAIKVLPADRLTDAGRRQRFIQEARAASALNHPHIVTIYEIEHAGDHDFIVMEYIRGRSLDQVIPRHGLRLSEVLRIAIPVADALAAAHARGIIHRDIKPANVMVGDAGEVKVLDFGLAKLLGREVSAEDETSTHVADPHVSRPGTVTGTAAYMSPEQALGEKLDTRSDIFSFGAMLYEMVTGVRAFGGASTADVLNAIVRTSPKRPTEVAPDVPLELERVVVRCLRREPDRRFQHIGDVKVALQEIKEESESGSATVTARPRRWRGLVLAVAASLAVITIVAVWWRGRQAREPARALMRMVPLTTLPGVAGSPTFSPDGRQVAFTWNGQKQDNFDIYVTFVGSTDVRRLTNDPLPDLQPRWSPDGRSIAFLRERADGTTVQVISSLGGADRNVSDFRGADSLSWSPDSRWLAAGRFGKSLDRTSTVGDRGIYLMPVEGGEPRHLITPTTGDTYISVPAFSPDGRRLAYSSCTSPTTIDLVMGSCDVFAVDLDATLTPTAPARAMTHERLLFLGSIAWTSDGHDLIYAGTSGDPGYLWRVAADGTATVQRLEIAGFHADEPAIASAGDRLAFTNSGGNVGIWRFDTEGSVQPMVGSSNNDGQARLSSDGRRVAFTSARYGNTSEIWVAGADGSDMRQLTHGPGRDQGAPFWSPDDHQLVFDSFGDDNRYHIWIIDANGGTPHRVTTEVGDQNAPTWSHDGRWVYYSADQGNGRDIWRVPPRGGTPERVTRGGSGYFACESPDGKSLVYQPRESDMPLMTMSLVGGTARQSYAA